MLKASYRLNDKFYKSYVTKLNVNKLNLIELEWYYTDVKIITFISSPE